MIECVSSNMPSTAGQFLEVLTWLPEGQPKGVIQLVHGMAEHIARYDAPARYLAEQGYVVAGHTHLGHGRMATLQGYFADANGWDHLVEDVDVLRNRLDLAYPDLPYFLLGHSMGSFVVRCYLRGHCHLRDHAKDMAGCVLSGTGYFSKATVFAGLTAANLVCRFGGEKKPSALIDKLAFASSNKPFEPVRTPFDWLSRDEDEVDKYIADPYCGFLFTGSGYRDLFRGLKRLTDPSELTTIPKDLPLLLFSGERDPVGGMGKGVKKVAEEFRQAGLVDVTVKLYPEGRHEMFNELNREEVYADLAAWVGRHVVS